MWRDGGVVRNIVSTCEDVAFEKGNEIFVNQDVMHLTASYFFHEGQWIQKKGRYSTKNKDVRSLLKIAEDSCTSVAISLWGLMILGQRLHHNEISVFYPIPQTITVPSGHVNEREKYYIYKFLH